MCCVLLAFRDESWGRFQMASEQTICQRKKAGGMLSAQASTSVFEVTCFGLSLPGLLKASLKFYYELSAAGFVPIIAWRAAALF